MGTTPAISPDEDIPLAKTVLGRLREAIAEWKAIHHRAPSAIEVTYALGSAILKLPEEDAWLERARSKNLDGREGLEAAGLYGVPLKVSEAAYETRRDLSFKLRE